MLALAAGFGIAIYAYMFITDPQPRQQRQLEEAVVMAARGILRDYVAAGRDLDVVDPVAPDRKIGKVYIYPADNGWQVSGYYQRNGDKRWHPWLMTLDSGKALIALDVRDTHQAIVAAAAEDPRFTAKP